jgi:hypothetical protein
MTEELARLVFVVGILADKEVFLVLAAELGPVYWSGSSRIDPPLQGDGNEGATSDSHYNHDIRYKRKGHGEHQKGHEQSNDQDEHRKYLEYLSRCFFFEVHNFYSLCMLVDISP